MYVHPNERRQIGNLIEARRFLAHAEMATTLLLQQKQKQGQGQEGGGGGRAVASSAEAQVCEWQGMIRDVGPVRPRGIE